MNARAIPFQQVKISGFWQKRREINRNVTLDAVYRRFVDTGRFAGLDFSAEATPHIFYDSDIAKWAEAVAYALTEKRDARLERIIDDAVEHMIAAQRPDGYYNMYFERKEPENVFTDRTRHELYCAGHLLEAALAYFDATGKRRFLDMMLKYMDYIEKVFLIDKSAAFTTPGHEEIELALIKCYRATRDEKYLRMARFFVDERGVREEREYEGVEHCYSQSHLPVREQRTAEGHAVRAVYLYSAMADLALTDGDEAMKAACQAIFQNIVQKRMYITGGIGSAARGEAFTTDYDLPNLTAYSESCAAIGLMMFARRMSLIDSDAIYADVTERALYNGFLSAVSLDGKSFFYENPLAINPRLKNCDTSQKRANKRRLPSSRRREVFDCSCCPPNIARFFESLGDYLYAENDDTFFIHQYVAGGTESGGLRVTVETDYPVSGRISIHITGGAGKKIALRRPAWCEDAAITVNGAPFTQSPVRGYWYVPAGDETHIALDFPMRPVLMETHPAVYEDGGRVAVQYGPVVYCAEGADNGENLSDLRLSSELNTEIEYAPEYGCAVLTVDAYRRPAFAALYRPAAPAEKTRARLIPYFAFANREETEMAVWLLKN